MSLSPEEREALLRLFSADISEICGGTRNVGLSITYHRVKGRYEYPALVVQCKGKRRKLHINQALWSAYREEVEKIKFEKIFSCLNKLENIRLYPLFADKFLAFLERLGEIYTNKSFWEYILKLVKDRVIRDNVFPHWKFHLKDNLYVEIWDLYPLKELKFEITKIEVVRGEVKRFETVSYIGKERNIYILRVKPLKVLEINEEEIGEFIEKLL